MFYLVPSTLEKEAEILKEYIVSMQKTFQDKCTAERKRIDDEKKALLNAREWKYDIETVTISNENWSILTKTAINPVECADDNKQWSIPFKTINRVRFHCPFYHQQKRWITCDSLIPQGLIEEGVHQQYEGW